MNAVERVLTAAGVLVVLGLVLAPVLWSIWTTFGAVRW